jgi:hypothetical protein
MTLEDIYNTLRDLNYITAKERTPPPPPRPPPGTPIKYLRGRKNGPGITRRGLARTTVKDDSNAPLVIPTEYTLHWSREELETYVAIWRAKEHLTIQPRCLKWSPFLLSRTRNAEMVDADADGADPSSVRPATGAATTDQDRWSASSTKVTQTGPHDVAVSTPKLPGEPLSEATHIVEAHIAEVEASKPLVHKSASRDANQVAEDHAFATELARTSESPRRLRTRSRSYREASNEESKSTPSTSELVLSRTLRSSASVKRRVSNTEEAMAEPVTSQDSALAARLAREEGTRQTRSMSNRIDPAKTNMARASPRKRQRVESSPSIESDDDNSLSDLTDDDSISPSPSPQPQPRRVKRAVNGRSKSLAQNGTNGAVPKSSVQARSWSKDAPPLTSRLPSRKNGMTSNLSSTYATAKEKPANEEAPARTRSMQKGKADSIRDDSPNVNSKQTVSEPYRKDEEGGRDKGNEEVRNGAVDGCQTSLNVSAERVNGEGLDGVTPGMYDEDALGEEDAEGEEDPNPSDVER